MVIKGKQRAGARNLARHLSRTDTNETAELVELRGVAARSLKGALCEIEAVAAGTRCKQALYHAMINTHPQEPLTPDQWAQAVERLEDGLGLTGQPRAIVRHIKDGREHLHVVWSRIDIDKMKAIPLGHNYAKHERVSRQLEQEFGHRTVKGVHTGDRSEPRPIAAVQHDEHQQAERQGVSVAQVRATLTDAWRTTTSGRGFADVLAAKGYIVARGDRRDHVVLDSAGTAHTPRRRIDGATAAEIKDRLADLDPAKLPSVAEARALLKDRRSGSGDKGETARRAPRSTPPVDLTELPLPANTTAAPIEGSGDDAGFMKSISRAFRRWIAKAGSFIQSWQDRAMRAFNSGFQLAPELPRSGGDDRKAGREEYKPGSNKAKDVPHARDERDRDDDR